MKSWSVVRRTVILFVCAALAACAAGSGQGGPASSKGRNVIFILVDDHRYDAMGFAGHPFVETPHMDAMAKNGVYFPNAFVTTSLCSPSRASILSGLYVHNHGVMDNNTLLREGTVTFPETLQKAGYETAFVGKWHMGGHHDNPRPGFDYWVSFRGQGSYHPDKSGLNVNGRRVQQKGYITDELTDYAMEWLNGRDLRKPFFLYLSHKAVHGMFFPAERHKGRYKDVKIDPPETYADTPENYKDKPMWVKNQRNSWHGVDFSYHNTRNALEIYRDYCEALLAVDDSVGRVMAWLKEKGLEEETLVIYMGDNGFLWGEHGLIDKRCAYEESMKVPMMAQCPALFSRGRVEKGVVANIDIAPTILEATGVKHPKKMDGQSFLGLAAGKVDLKDWRDFLLYEYYWEYNFPQTPTCFALRGNQYKLIQYHGIWDIDELYDIQNDPREKRNLLFEPDQQKRVAEMREKLYNELKDTGGLQIPLGFKRSHGASLRYSGGSKEAPFPPQFMRDKGRD